MKLIYSDNRGKLFAQKDNITGSIVVKVEYMDLLPEKITFPNEAIDKLITFLSESKNEEMWECDCDACTRLQKRIVDLRNKEV